jgi:hypothetical protein
MGWIEKSRSERREDVSDLVARLLRQSPDRFWVSNEQDGPDKQIMHILLPAGEDIYYNITLMTAQLKAARLAAYDLGQRPGERIAITPTLLDRLGILGEEVFLLDHGCKEGIGLELVINEPGLTHPVIDEVLGRFLDNGQIPLAAKPINTYDLVSRLVSAREEGKHSDFPL